MDARIETQIEQRPQGRVARIMVCNAAKLNILNTPLIRDLVKAFATVSDDPELRAVVLAGEGERAFIGGADITEMAGLTPATGREFIRALRAALEPDAQDKPAKRLQGARAKRTAAAR